MRYLTPILLLIVFIACQQKAPEESYFENPSVIESETLTAYYPTNWEIAENSEDEGSKVITLKPKDSLSSSVMSIVVLKAELPLVNTLTSMKGNVYLTLDVNIDAIEEDEAIDTTYQDVPALFQTYQVQKDEKEVQGQFVTLNKSGRCYVIFFQSANKALAFHKESFKFFLEKLEVR